MENGNTASQSRTDGEMRETEAKTSRAQTERTAEMPGAAQTAGAAERRYPVRHNKETVQLTLGELTGAASKGLDYDRIRPSHELIKTLAQESGIRDVGRYIRAVQQILREKQNPEGNGGDAGRESGEPYGVHSEADRENPAPDGAKDAEAARKSGDGAGMNGGAETDSAEPAQGKADAALGSADEWAAVAREYPDAVRGGQLHFPDGALRLLLGGRAGGPLEALRLNERSELTGRLRAYEARAQADRANAEAADATPGNAAGGDARERDFYTSEEWDRQTEDFKRRHILNGNFFKWAKRWN